MIQEIDLSTGKQKQNWLDVKRYNSNWFVGGLGRAEESFFYARSQEACKYVHFFMDTIISIGKNQVEPFAVLKDKDWISSKDLAKIIEDKKGQLGLAGLVCREISQREIAFDIHNYVEWDDYFFFRYVKKDNNYYVFHNIKTGKTRITEDIINDLVNEQPWLVSSFNCADENGVYEVIGMFSIERYIEKLQEDGFLKKSVDRYEELRTLPEDTNPIIFYYEFKRDEEGQ